MTCPSCGASVPDWALQCPSCGASLPRQQSAGTAPSGWGSPGTSDWGAPGTGTEAAAWSTPSPAAGGARLAGWWYRVGATIIDGIILGVVSVVLDLALARAGGTVITLIVGMAYNGYFLSSRGQTPGMMAVGTRVADVVSGGNISFWRGVGRYAMEELLAVLFFVPWIVDVLWPLWDKRNQTLHDKVVNTVVVHAR